MALRPFHTLSVCSGGGGLDLGFEWATGVRRMNATHEIAHRLFDDGGAYFRERIAVGHLRACALRLTWLAERWCECPDAPPQLHTIRILSMGEH